MKVVVIGATGNAGTAVLRALGHTHEVTDIVGVARRLPDAAAEPYAGCRWESVDIAAASTAEDAVPALRAIFEGADAVIHLAWLIQPNDRRDLLERVNVEGTRRVAEAVAAAGVPHLVVASSVGAYSPDEARGGDEVLLRDETWATGGIGTSHYSVDKAAQERVLDEFETRHPDVVVTRMRTALLFQAEAAAEIQRYFLGSLAPVQALKLGRPLALPLPKGLVLQTVHSDDAGRAYAAAVVRKTGGAFNVCADDVLGPQELADVVDHGRYFELPPAVVRGALVAAHGAGLVPADPGWLDMGMQVPMMDNGRAVDELGWRPERTAGEALAELVEGLAEGTGVAASPPLRPRDSDEATIPAIDESAGSGADAGTGSAVVDSDELPDAYAKDLLELYLSDHFTGATAGANRIERMADDFVDTPVYAELAELARDIRAERTFLGNLIDDLGLKRKPYRQALAWAGERVGRLKGNGKVIDRSPMTMLLEADLMRSAINGKLGVWETLRDHAEPLGLDRGVFERLIEGYREQSERLDEIHSYARARALREDRTTFWD
ncbi:MAG: NAD-dependent epimerase/dehydratase family protein [Propionibacterium sp.]|nr:NAD-dependent epimerase/dehydratase family protein [Propionibacterium sp.]